MKIILKDLQENVLYRNLERFRNLQKVFQGKSRIKVWQEEEGGELFHRYLNNKRPYKGHKAKPVMVENVDTIKSIHKTSWTHILTLSLKDSLIMTTELEEYRNHCIKIDILKQ